eukprot:2395095-Pyramimonas_sp.AAC.1
MDGEMRARMDGETRPLSLSNTENKTIIACIGWPLPQAVGDRVASAQRGFLRGRQLTEGIIEVDAALPLGHAVSVEQAFPSVVHTYKWAILRACGVPEFLVLSILALNKAMLTAVCFSGSRPISINPCV